MKNHALIIVFLLVLVSRSCNVNDLVSEVANGKITAKEKLGEVIKKARSDFASDSKLAVIYGRNVSTSGEIDLLGDDLTSNFYYIVQSDSVAAVDPGKANQFYIPVYKSDPISTEYKRYFFSYKKSECKGYCWRRFRNYRNSRDFDQRKL